MSLPPQEELGIEIHKGNDQFFRFEQGASMCIIDDNEYLLKDGTAVIVPQGSMHNIINTSHTEHLKFYTIYSPPHHKDGTMHTLKADEQGDDEHFDGVTSE